METEIKRSSITGYYAYKDNTYGVIGECKMKSKSGWVIGVVYVKSGELYVRSAKDFKDRFEKVSNPFLI